MKKYVKRALIVTVVFCIVAAGSSSMAAAWKKHIPDTGGEPSVILSRAGTYDSGIVGAGAAEICDYDPDTSTLFVVNGANVAIDMLDISNPQDPVHIGAIDITPYGAAPTSVAVSGGLVAVAVPNEITQMPGKVIVFSTQGEFLKAFIAGALPDMVMFTPGGDYILAANEGEPNDDYSVDPEGSVSIIDLTEGLAQATVKTADFKSFNDKKDILVAKGIRVFGPNASVAQDLEPEYITVAPNSAYAWVSLQENNAMAKVHIRSGCVVDILPLGFSDLGLSESIPESGLGKHRFRSASSSSVIGMRQPDGIASYNVGEHTYIVTANEGDTRVYQVYLEEVLVEEAFNEEALVKDLILDPIAFPSAEVLQNEKALGLFTVTNTMGDCDDDGDMDRLYAVGTRSFSIFKVTHKGLKLVFDSGDEFEHILAEELPDEAFSDETLPLAALNVAQDPEPEGVAIGSVDGRTYAFIGLERAGGIMAYDITNPYFSRFVQYINNRDFSVDAFTAGAGDVAPEGIVFISADESPVGIPMLAVANEVSGTTTLYTIDSAD